MKNIISALLFCAALSSQATTIVPDSSITDSTIVVVDTTAVDPFSLDVYLYSRYVWRGVGFGGSPSVQAQVAYTHKGFIAACYVSKSLNGNSVGFSNTSNVMLGYQYKGFSVTLDDYFFYDEDNLDRYLDWSDTTLHFIETRLRYDGNRWYGFAGYNVYAAEMAVRDGVYIEGGYRIPKHDLTLFVGYLTDGSDLNFTTTAGITNIGITKEKRLRFSDKFSIPITGSLIVNPNYVNVVDLPRVTRSFITLVVGTQF